MLTAEWVARARDVPIEEELGRRGILLRGNKTERCGPCPRCGGDDRFSINTIKQVFNCRGCDAKGDVIDLVRFIDGVDFDSACTTLAGEPRPHTASTNGHAQPKANGWWIYNNEDGTPYLGVKRLDLPDGKKSYPQYRWNGTAWDKGKPAGPKIPYRLPELLRALGQPVFVCEGEKCADAVASLGWLATTASEGAGHWTADLNKWFADRAVYILVDNDEPGRKHAGLVASNLYGIAREVRVVELEGLADGEDVFDWLERDPFPENLLRIAEDAAVWQKPDQPAADEQHKSKQRFELTRFQDILLSSSAFYLVKGLIPRGGLVIVWGPPKCGKSFWTFDLAMHIALGEPYRGRRVQQGIVVYLALEGAHGFRARIEAWRRKHGDSNAPFYLMTDRLDLVKDHETLIAAIRAQIGTDVPVLVVVDTLNRSLAGSESKDEDMAAFIRAADAIREAFGCAVLIVHHCGVDSTRPRGHTSLVGAVDAQLAVTRDGAGNIVVTVEFMKDGPEGDVILSGLEQVELGQDDDGDPIASCVVVPVEGKPVQPTAKRKLSDRQRLAIEALDESLATVGKTAPASPLWPANTIAVPMEAWRAEMLNRGVIDKAGANPRRDFERVRQQLHARHIIGVLNGSVWKV